MDAEKLQLKLFWDGPALPLEGFIPVLHDWIKHHRLGELLVDVANYTHVPKGPGVGIVGNASDYFIDGSEGRQGLLCSRKREAPLASERLRDLFRRTLNAAVLLEKEPAWQGKLRFRTDEWLFRVNDRLAAPAAEATFASVRAELEGFCATLFGSPPRLALVGGPRALFSVRISSDGKTALPALLDRVGGGIGGAIG